LCLCPTAASTIFISATVCEDDSAHEHDDETNAQQKKVEFNALWARYQRGWADEGDEPNVVSLDDLAFVVYSSGTTGQPKGDCHSASRSGGELRVVLSYFWGVWSGGCGGVQCVFCVGGTEGVDSGWGGVAGAFG